MFRTACRLLKMALRIDILTLFPEMFCGVLGTSIPKRAAEKGLVEYELTNIRDFATDAHKSVDDKPFGGGPGMVMMCQTVFDAVESAEKQDLRDATRIVLTPQGRLFDQRMAEDFAGRDRLLLIAGHYEGFDERIIDGLRPMEVSIGDYVLSGGELAAMVVIDAVVRLLPGALGAEDGAADETFADGLIEYPQYTRPREFRGMSVPDVLLSGNHAAIAKWRLEQRKIRTRDRRPDLWDAHEQKEKGKG
jgi:tRNA (guanine37-N1)-methyltransferase